MADHTPVDTDYTEPEGTVTLVSPSGGEYRTHNAVEINNLVYGQGYKVKDGELDPAAQTESPSSADAVDEPTTATIGAPAAPSQNLAGSKATPKAPASKASMDKAAGTPTPPSAT